MAVNNEAGNSPAKPQTSNESHQSQASLPSGDAEPAQPSSARDDGPPRLRGSSTSSEDGSFGKSDDALSSENLAPKAASPSGFVKDPQEQSGAGEAQGGEPSPRSRKTASQDAISSKLTASNTSGTQTPSKKSKNIFGYTSAFFLSALTVVGLIHNKTQPIEETRCTTKGCHLMAKVLRKIPNAESICHDFYNAVCSNQSSGGTKEWPGSKITAQVSRLGEIEEQIFLNRIIKIATPEWRENISDTVLDSEMQMGKFYLSCHNRENNTDDSRRFFLALLNDLGIPMEFDGDKQLLSMFSALVRLSLIWGINNPLLYVELKPFRAMRYYVTVIRTLKKYLFMDDVRLNVRRKREEKNPDTDDLQHNVWAFYNNSEAFYGFENLTNLHRAEQTLRTVFSGRHALPEERVRELLICYDAVTEFLSWRTGYMNVSNITEPFKSNFITLEGLHEFPWRQAITYGVRQHLNLSRDSEVVIDRPDVSGQMAVLLMDPRLHRIFRQYLYVWLLRHLEFSISKKTEDVACDFDPAGCPNRGEERETYCFRKVREYFPRSYVSLVNRTLGSDKSDVKVKVILSSLVLQIARMVKETCTLDTEDRMRTMELLATMVIYQGNPAYLNELRAVEYSCAIGRNFFQNVLMIRRSRNEEKLIIFEQTFYLSSKRWPHMPISQPDAYYDVDQNALMVPASLMVFPHYLLDGPLWLGVAGMGWNVIHKIFHVFDTSNRAYPLALYRTTRTWQNETKRKYEDAMECFIEAYRGIKPYYPPHMVYNEEAAFDNAAVQILSQAFDFIERQFSRDFLPEDVGYTYPDIYWIAAVKPFCYTSYVYTDKDKSYRFSRARINYALRNLKKFPKGLGCHPNSFMRGGQCQAWVVA